MPQQPQGDEQPSQPQAQHYPADAQDRAPTASYEVGIGRIERSTPQRDMKFTDWASI